MHSCGHSAWDNSFYNQYLQQHTHMTQWFQQLQQSINPNRSACCTHAQPSRRGHTMQHFRAPPPCCSPRGRPVVRGPRHCCSAQARPACCVAPSCCPPFQLPQQYTRASAMPPPRNMGSSRGCMTRLPAGRHSSRVSQPHGYPVMGPAMRRAQVAKAYVEKQEEESDDSMEDEEDNSSSDDEIVCDIEAIMAVPIATDDSDKVSEDSFDLVDSVEDEKFKFEYVEMDEYGIVQRRNGKRREVNTLQDELLKKEQREYLYGERADAICGLETLMAINFDHFSDMNQPILWPVLPLAL